MPKANGYSCLQVWVDTFFGWIEAFSSCGELAKEVIKILIHEIILRFGLPWSLQSVNGSAFKAVVTRGVKSSRNIMSLTLFLETPVLQEMLKKLMTLPKDICAN